MYQLYRDFNLVKKGQKIRAWVNPPPLFGQCPKENVLFLMRSSLIVACPVEAEEVGEEVEEGEEVEFFIFLAAQGFNHFYLSGSPCTCNGVTVPTGWWKGLGSCGSLGVWVDCGDFCFVKGDCADQFLLYGLKEYGYASCTPCPQSRNAPPLKTAECPNNGSPSSIGNGIWLLAAAGRQCVGDPQFFMVISKKNSSQESCWRSSSDLDLDIQPVRLHYIIKKKVYFSSNILIQTVAKKIELFNKCVIISLRFCCGYYNDVSHTLWKD